MLKNIHWLILIGIYLSFFIWYTNLSGPVTTDEINEYLLKGSEDFKTEDLFREFLENDDGKDFYMVNYLDLNEDPPNLPATGQGASAWDLLGHYNEFMFPNLFSRACHPVFGGPVVSDALDLLNIEEGKTWDYVVIMRYRSRRDLADIATNPDFFGRHDYKIGSLDKTIAVPVNPRFTTDFRYLLFFILFTIGLIIQVFKKKTN